MDVVYYKTIRLSESMKLNLNQCNTKTISFTETQIYLKTKIKHFSISKIKKKRWGGAAVLTDGCDALLRPSALLSMASSARDRHKNTHIIENKGN